MKVVKIGGPVYRIGVGGGSASSVKIHGDNENELDFGAVQRGDPEMEQKLNRVIRACLELESKNPILSIHDQGAGGNGKFYFTMTKLMFVILAYFICVPNYTIVTGLFFFFRKCA